MTIPEVQLPMLAAIPVSMKVLGFDGEELWIVVCSTSAFVAPEAMSIPSPVMPPFSVMHTLLTVTFAARMDRLPVMFRFWTVCPGVEAVTLPDGASDEQVLVAPTLP
jgi:hypothetical protein